jgi:hypothetical protein
MRAVVGKLLLLGVEEEVERMRVEARVRSMLFGTR